MSQVRTVGITTEAIMRTAAFAAGVDDVRNGRPANYAQFDFNQGEPERGDEHWDYERGRLWARLAPLSMPLKINGKLNPKAVALADAAFNRKYII